MPNTFIPPLSEPVDLLLADIAIRLQLSRTDYKKAEDRYKTLEAWLDRDDSDLKDLVKLIYPQGGMAIEAVIAKGLTTDEFDVDAVIQLLLSPDSDPEAVLNLVFESIRGKKGSRYYDMAERRTRCVTIHYADKMHVDVTPLVRLEAKPERVSNLFHSKPEDPYEPDQTLVANPYGFAEWFKEKTPIDADFARSFSERMDAYEQSIHFDAAETEPLPAQAPISSKSRALVVLQLLKRWRNVCYDKRQGRRPPSILLAKLVADSANQTAALSQELLHQAMNMRNLFQKHDFAGQLISVRNPTCDEDIITDRWPASPLEQCQFTKDLEKLCVQLEYLLNDCDLSEMRDILSDLFGEAPAHKVIEEFNDSNGSYIRSGKSLHSPSGGIITPVFGERALATAKPTPAHNFFGS